MRWGILSTARINRRFIPALRKSCRSELVACGGRDSERTRAFADCWEIGGAEPSCESVLARSDIDVVYIPLPNSLHREWAVRAARAGRHILCEKPLGVNRVEAEVMAAAAGENGVVLMEAMAYRCHPQFLRLRELLRAGAVGKVRLIRSWFRFSLPPGDNIRWLPELGGGVLLDVGCYPVNFALAVAGELPEAVSSTRRRGPTGVDILTAGRLEFPSGTVAQFDCSFVLPYGAGAEVIGEEGVIRIVHPWQPDTDGKGSGLIRVARDDSETAIPTTPADPYLCEIEAMEAAVLDGIPLPYPVSESLLNARVLESLAAD
ncbi:MAG: Gfo/Idh/MocA family oxidoreductase [Candidatus Erginobacter occultus]|nr:Gfo/Idh/MocA family oxidoreductase [Candidatus Erginobacter occultus]